MKIDIPIPTEINYSLSFKIGSIIGIIGIIILTLYYLIIYLKSLKGHYVKSEGGNIRYTPPDISPAVVSFIRNKSCNWRVHFSSLMNMAVKGFITIIIENNMMFRIVRTNLNDSILSGEEKEISNVLFKNANEIKITSLYNSNVVDSFNVFEKYMKSNYLAKYFLNNEKYLKRGVIFSIIFVVLSSIIETSKVDFVGIYRVPFMILFLSFFNLLFFIFSIATIVGWLDVFKKGIRLQGFFKSISGAIIITFFGLCSLIAPILSFLIISSSMSFVFFIVYMLYFCVNILFTYYLLGMCTLEGRKVLNEIKYWENYLVCKGEYFDPIAKSSNLFEKYLPYALSLNLEDALIKKYAEVLQNSEYQPKWCQGQSVYFKNIKGVLELVENSIQMASQAR